MDVNELAAERKRLVIASRSARGKKKTQIEQELASIQRQIRQLTSKSSAAITYGLAYGASALPVEEEDEDVSPTP
jgi:hypothetical protein